MRPLRIAMLAPFGIRPKGTLLARMLPLAQALSDQGHHVHIIAPPIHNPDDAQTSVMHGSVRVTHTAATPAGMVGVMRQARWLWQHVQADKPDVVHLFKPKGHAGLAARWGKVVASQIPLVVDCDDREGVGGWNDILPYPPHAKALFAWQEVDLPRVADAVTVASRTLQGLVWASGVPHDATFYVPNAARITQQEPFVARTAPVLVLYTRFWEFALADMVASMARIVARCPQVEVHVIGTGENGEELQFAQMLAQHQLTEHVTMHGWLQPDHIPPLLRQASVALVPVADTLINRARCSAKLLELLAAGLAVVGHDVGEMRTFIQHRENGLLVDPARVDALDEAVCALLENPTAMTAMQASAYTSAQHHAWHTRVAACEAAYAYALHRV
ncbi:MAG: glycosyltransferase family 4 protein [Chloroflexi bacterium]|nr:glycosyltransferase family 4 protein [Chloroflexota bacterium]